LGQRRLRLIIALNRSNEAVPAFGERFDESGVRRVIAERISKLREGNPETLVKIHKRIACPQPLAEFLAGDNLAMSLDEPEQQLERLVLDADFMSLSDQPSRS
jgi:hypothetical protein